MGSFAPRECKLVGAIGSSTGVGSKDFFFFKNFDLKNPREFSSRSTMIKKVNTSARPKLSNHRCFAAATISREITLAFPFHSGMLCTAARNEKFLIFQNAGSKRSDFFGKIFTRYPRSSLKAQIF